MRKVSADSFEHPTLQPKDLIVEAGYHRCNGIEGGSNQRDPTTEEKHFEIQVNGMRGFHPSGDR
jgi:hypothetical protein